MDRLHVVTLAKNDRPGLAATCKSVERQMGVRFHHHLVTGMSTDGTEELAQTLSRSDRVTHWTGAPPGIYESMNWILRQVPSNDFIWFLNAGDVLTDECSIQRMYEALGFSSAEWCTSAFLVATRSGWVRDVVTVSEPWQPHDVGHQATVARVALLEEAGGFPEVPRILADAALMRRVMRNHTPAIVSEPTVIYTLGGFSSRHPMKVTREIAWLDRYLPLAGRDSLSASQGAKPSVGQMLLPLASALEGRAPRVSSLFVQPRGKRRRYVAAQLLSAPHWEDHPVSSFSRACCLSMS